MSASDSAKSRMERILRLHEQIDALKLDIRQVYAEEKADGGDKTAMGAAVSYIRKRDKEGSDLADREAMADVYVAAYDAPRTHTHAREASYSEAKGRGDAVGNADAIAEKVTGSYLLSTTPKASVSKASSAETGDLGTTPFDPETGELTDNQDQIGGNGTDLPVEASTDKQAAGASRPTPSNSAAHSPAERAGEAPSSSQASPATLSDMPISTTPSFAGCVTGDMPDIPDFLRRTEPKAREWEEA